MNQNKLKIIETIDKMQNELLTLSHQIHDHPELGFQEHQAVGFIRTFLEGHGFEVETPYCGLDTSFKAVKKGKHAGPRIAFLAEYDALRGIGHGCGHNIIATCAVGAFSGLAAYDASVRRRIESCRKRGTRCHNHPRRFPRKSSPLFCTFERD